MAQFFSTYSGAPTVPDPNAPINAGLYDIVPTPNGHLSINGGAPALVPKGGSINADGDVTGAAIFNIVHDYSWTLSPKGAAVRGEIPFAKLTEKKLRYSALVGQGAAWAYVFSQSFSDSPTNPYKYLYPARSTGFTYFLPFFGPENRQIGNVWSDSNIFLENSLPEWVPALGGRSILREAEAISKAFYVGVGHEVPKAYSAGSCEQITINFVLLNTTTLEDVQQNYDFCYAIAYQNLQNRRTAILLEPPVFYEYEIPGIKYSNAAIISNLSITNLGQTKKIKNLRDGKDKVIPEAYNISITLTDLIPQSRNIANAMLTEDHKLVTTSDALPLPTLTTMSDILSDLGPRILPNLTGVVRGALGLPPQP